MFKETLHIKPKLDQSDLKQMEKSLSGRFARVAKGFGRGLGRALKGGAALGAMTAVVDRLLNPLKEVQSVLDRILNSANDVSTFAGQLGTSEGSFAKLLAIGQSTGMDDQRLIKLLTRFQTEVGRAKLDPERQTPVRDFTKFDDSSEGFFQFIQGLQSMDDKSKQAAAISMVFGERALVELSDLLQTDLPRQAEILGLNELDSKALEKSVQHLNEMSRLDRALSARRNLEEMQKAGAVVTDDTIGTRHRSALIEQDRNISRIREIETLATMSEGVDKIFFTMERVVQTYGGFIGEMATNANRLVGIESKMTGILDGINAFRKGTFSKFARRITGGGSE